MVVELVIGGPEGKPRGSNTMYETDDESEIVKSHSHLV